MGSGVKIRPLQLNSRRTLLLWDKNKERKSGFELVQIKNGKSKRGVLSFKKTTYAVGRVSAHAFLPNSAKPNTNSNNQFLLVLTIPEHFTPVDN